MPSGRTTPEGHDTGASERTPPRVDFYVLEAVSSSGRTLAACRLAEKAWRTGHRVHLLTTSVSETRELDDLLWTFRQASFVPHAPSPGGSLPSEFEIQSTPVWVSEMPIPGARADVLINLTDHVPLEFRDFRRVAEIIDGTGEGRHSGRKRFREYRGNGCEVHTHEI